MADGNKMKSFEDSIRKVEALIQQLQQIKAVHESNQRTEEHQQLQSFQEEIETPTPEIEAASNEDASQEIESTLQIVEDSKHHEREFSQFPLSLDLENVQISEEYRIEQGIVEDPKEFQIQIKSTEVSFFQQETVIFDILSKEMVEIAEVSVDIIETKSAHKVFDKMLDEDLPSLSILSKNSNLEVVDFDPGGMCCLTWLFDFDIGCEAMERQFILAVFDPGIASFGMGMRKSKLFVDMPKCLLCINVDYSYHLVSTWRGQNSFPYDRGRACEFQGMKQRLTFIDCRSSTPEKHIGGAVVIDPGIPGWMIHLLELPITIAAAIGNHRRLKKC